MPGGEFRFEGGVCALHSGRAQVGEGLAPKSQVAEIPHPVHGQVPEQVGLERRRLAESEMPARGGESGDDYILPNLNSKIEIREN